MITRITGHRSAHCVFCQSVDINLTVLLRVAPGRQKLHYYSDNNSRLRKSVWQVVPIPEIDYSEDQVFAWERRGGGISVAHSE
jgi:hypothetical protein